MAAGDVQMKVSIAIPCRNAARWLRQCISSALAQEGAEIIVVDDASTDGSADIAREFGGRIKLLPGGGRGATHARNLALAQATGEWVQFLDADDYLEPAKISTQLREARDGVNADVVYSPVWIETVTPSATSREQSASSPDADIFTQWIRWHIPQTGGALWRREALNRIGGWKEDQPCCQEHELYLRALIAGLRFSFAPTPGATYRIWSEDTLCRKDPLLVVRVRTELMDKLRAWLAADGKLSAEHLAAVGRQCFEMARTWAKHDLAGAAKYHAERKARGLIAVTGPAAPWKYRLAYRLFGFRGAERLAARAR
jgi:glycosyltransferase involved in cell wall biosynthesis